MRKFINDIGCLMEFEDSISDDIIKSRLEIFGGKWEEIEKKE